MARSGATAKGLRVVAEALTAGGGAGAAQLRVAEQYVEVGWGLELGPSTLSREQGCMPCVCGDFGGGGAGWLAVRQ